MASTNTSIQIFCSTKEAFNSLVNPTCFCSKDIKDTNVVGLLAYEYTVTFSGIHTEYGCPVLLQVLIGRAYATDTIAMRALATKQDDLITFVKEELSEKTFTDNTMVTSGDGFSTSETIIRAL